MRQYYIHIPKKKKHLFPEPPAGIELEDNTLILKACVKSDSHGGAYIGRFLEWFKVHPELKVGDKVRITIIEPMKKYRLEIVE